MTTELIFLLGGIGIGIITAYFFFRAGRRAVKETAEKTAGLIESQAKEKAENLEKVMGLFAHKEQITNDDVENLLGISDATATRYLDELESEGKILQVGEAGRGVYYRVK